jgi:hypothetical protein
MPQRKVKKELDTPEAFERALREELSVSADFGLPLSVLVLRVKDPRGSFEPETVRLLSQAVRVADLICQPDPSELLIALPNTEIGDARVVQARLRSTVPEAAFGRVHRAKGDAPATLLERARDAARASEPPSLPGS